MSKIVAKLSNFAVFNNGNCKIKDPSRVERILNQFAAGGVDRLQMITDFDFTITKQRLENGEKVKSSFGILSELLPESYRQKDKALMAKYRPIEEDPNMDKAEKTKAMIEFWTHSSEVLKGFSVSADDIERVTQRYKHATRDGSKELFDELHRVNVPVLVFSAGIGDTVTAMLRHTDLLLPNVKIVSNFLQYKDGLLDGFDTENMIHGMNKNESHLLGSKDYDFLHDRNNIIVMGDSLGDAEMGDGCTNGSDFHILKIGFLFGEIDLKLPAYMDAFDVVLVDDQTMNVPKAVVDFITQQ